MSYMSRAHQSVVIKTLGFSLAAVKLEGVSLLVELGVLAMHGLGAVADWGIGQLGYRVLDILTVTSEGMRQVVSKVLVLISR